MSRYYFAIRKEDEKDWIVLHPILNTDSLNGEQLIEKIKVVVGETENAIRNKEAYDNYISGELKRIIKIASGLFIHDAGIIKKHIIDELTGKNNAG